MNKNSIIAERIKLRGEIKELITQYETIKQKGDFLETIGPLREEKTFQLLNSIAMRYAKDGFIQYAESWLSKAEPLTLNNPKQAIILHNNMACIFKNQGNFEKAIQHLTKSEAVLKKVRSKLHSNGRFDRLLVDCWLNLSAIYSSKKMHQKALYVIESTEELLSQNLKEGHEKFIEQLIIARYNKMVELEHLDKIEEAYTCCDETRKMMNEKRVYGHFLEKKINQIHQDLRKKVYCQNKHKRNSSLAHSLSKLKDSQSTESKKENFHSRKMSGLLSKEKNIKLEAILEAKENCNFLTHKTTKSVFQQQVAIPEKKSGPSSRIRISPMMEITNKKITLA